MTDDRSNDQITGDRRPMSSEQSEMPPKGKLRKPLSSPPLTPSLPPLPPLSAGRELPDTLKAKGNEAFTRGDYVKAVRLYTEAIEAYPKPLEHEHEHLDAYRTPDSHPDSASALSSSSSLSGPVLTPLVPLYSNRSATYLALKKWNEAQHDAEAALSLAPHWPKGYLRRGQALEQQLQYHEALRSYQQGLALDPQDVALKKSLEELTVLLDELKLSQDELAQSATTLNPDSDRFARMVQWLKANGARFPKLYLQYYSKEHRGVHSLTRIPADDIILFVPFQSIMTSQVAMESEIGKLIVASQVDLRSKHSYLAAYLLQERQKGPQSFWYPYIQCLPSQYSNMPIFFPPSIMQLLNGSFTVQKIQDRIDSLRAEYDHIKACVPEFGRFTHDEFVWARLVVITRIFGLVIHGQKTDGLVPFADMLNHKKPRDSSDTDTKWTFDDQQEGFTIISLRTIARGEQVYDSYGRKDNARFFVNYGFSLEHNEDDNEALLQFQPIAQADGLMLHKQRMLPAHLQSTMFGYREFQVPATYRETNDREKKTKEMFSFLRFLSAKNADLLILHGHYQVNTMKVEDIEPISVENERLVLTAVGEAAQASLNKFDTSLEEDEALLASDTYVPFSNERNCVLQRRGEKQVLRWHLELSKTGIELLDAQWKDLKKRTAKSAQSNAPLDYYISHVIVPLRKRAG